MPNQSHSVFLTPHFTELSRTYLLALAAALLLLLNATASWSSSISTYSTTAAAALKATANPTSVPGGIYSWAIPDGASTVTFAGKPVFEINGKALIGIPLSQATGMVQLQYRLNGISQVHDFEVVDKQYTEQHITLKNKEMVNPNQTQITRIRRESTIQRALYQSHSEAIPLQEGFIMPLQGITTSLFGHRRFFNGQPRNPHSGLDVAAPEGTPIIAPGNARVVLADDLYFNGKSIFLDHGQGLVTMYCHLSEHRVAANDEVLQGQVVGLVGATGRATGPHLHWSVSLNGVRVDPEMFRDVLAQALAL